MAEPQDKVYFCDQCNRVVAKEQDGKLVLVGLHHGGENHKTTIKTAGK